MAPYLIETSSSADVRSATTSKTVKANILNEITNLLKTQMQDATVYANLSHAKNIEHDINSRHDRTEMLVKNISSNSKYLGDPSVKSDLIEIALQSCDTVEDRLKQFRIKLHAVGCLKPVLDELDDDFYINIYRQIKILLREQWESIDDSAIQEFDRYFIGCKKKVKFRLLETLLMCLTESVVDCSIFDDFPPSKWCEKLLIHYLWMNNEFWDADQKHHFVETVNVLHRFIENNSTRHSIEDVLEIFIKSQNECRRDIQFIIYVLTLLSYDIRTLDIITRGECVLPLVVHELEVMRLRCKCEQQKIIYNDEKLVELHELLLYSDKMVDRCLDNVKRNTHINELIDFFALLKDQDLASEHKVTFLEQLGSLENDDKQWKDLLFRVLVYNAIRCEFPVEIWGMNDHGIEDDDKTYFLSIKDKNQHTSYNGNFGSGKADLKRRLQSNDNGSVIHSLFDTFSRLISKLASDCQWSKKTVDYVRKYVQSIDNDEKIAQLNNSLEILIDYEIDIVESDILEIISHSNATNVRGNVHKFVIEETFLGTYKKSLDQLMDELLDTNDNGKVTMLKEKDTLLKSYNDVMNAYNGKSILFPDDEPIKNWNEDNIKEWINLSHTLKKCSEYFLAEGITVPSSWINDIINATPFRVLGNNGHKILEAALCNSNSFWDEKDINLHNERIAVIKRTVKLTSGIEVRDIQLLSVLLMINCEENRGRLAQINTGEGKTIVIAMIAAYHGTKGHHVDIITSSPQLAKPQSKAQKPFFAKLGLTVHHNFDSRAAYECNILYGTAHEFQGDILRDEFRDQDIRRGRKFDIVIVDEVDNMLIDGNNYIVLLSSTMPAMDHLETLLATIYAQVVTAAGSIIEEDGKAYFQTQVNAFDENSGNSELIPIEGTMREFVEKSTEVHVRSLIRDCDTEKLDKDYPEIKIPNHLRPFICNVQLKKWIERAIWAKFFYRENEEYIIEDNKIKIVDAKDTGVVRDNSHWSNGLHQFLGLKHGAKTSPESLTSNYISNVSFFRRYRPKIYGLTGTLGSDAAKELLCETYDVDTIVVPPFKSKRYKELKAICTESVNEWYREIAKSCLRKLHNGRAVLIIMEYIRETEELTKIFKERFQYESGRIKVYKTGADASVIEEPLKSGDVVITTNIAGRGTDIKLKEGVDQRGGLHVCVTFLPKNSRVELQNIGRTSRTGNRGTGQFVLMCANKSKDIDVLRAVRAIDEEKTMRMAKAEIEKVLTKDKIFGLFSKLIKSINGRNEDTKKFEQMAVEERFAIWLQEHDKTVNLRDFETFSEMILDDEANDELIKNPYIHVLIGNEYLEKKFFTRAIEEFTLAIDLDENFAEQAYYNRGYARIAESGNCVAANEDEIDRAIDDFEHARKLIEERESCLSMLQHASTGQHFSDHVTHKLNLYNVQKNAIDLAIGPDRDAIERQIKELEGIEEPDDSPENVEAKVRRTETIKNLKKRKRQKGVIQKARLNGNDLEIERLKLKTCLPEEDLESHKDEIKEFERNGFIGGFKISERPPIDWNAVIGLLLLGIAQLVIGGALAVFSAGAGASFGISLITEGVKDIITAVRDGIIKRTFSWAAWAVEKAINLTVAIVCAGWTAMKDVANTICSGARTTFSMIANRAVTESVKEGWKLGAKKVGQELAKGVGKELVKTLIDYGMNEMVFPNIQETIIDLITVPIQTALMNNESVEKMLELDKANKNRYYEELILCLGRTILNPAKDHMIVQIAEKIVHRIRVKKSKEYEQRHYEETIRSALKELVWFTEEFIKKLNQSISIEAERHKIHETADVKVEDTTDVHQEQPCTSEQPVSHENDIDLNRLNDNDTKVQSDVKPRTSKGIANVFTNEASAKMVGIIKSKITDPTIKKGLDWGMKEIASDVDRSINAAVEEFRTRGRGVPD